MYVMHVCIVYVHFIYAYISIYQYTRRGEEEKREIVPKVHDMMTCSSDIIRTLSKICEHIFFYDVSKYNILLDTFTIFLHHVNAYIYYAYAYSCTFESSKVQVPDI